LERIKVAVVGAGEIANGGHLPAWKKIPQVDVVAICDIDNRKAGDCAQKWGIARTYNSLPELLEKEPVDLIDLCTPPAFHLVPISQALKAGKHVIVEKPLALTIEDCDKILSVARSAEAGGVKLGVIHNQLFDPLFQKTLTMTREKAGGLLGVRIEFHISNDDAMLTDPKHWCRSLPGDKMGEAMIHPIYLLQAFLGPMKVDNIWAAKAGPYPWVPFDEAVVNFSSGKVFGEIYMSLNTPGYARTINVHGNKAALRMSGYNRTLVLLPTRTFTLRRRVFDTFNQCRQMMTTMSDSALTYLTRRVRTEHYRYFSLFVESIEQKKEPPVNPQDACDATKIALNIANELEQRAKGK
jgi:predicted dehydrogenase